MSKTYNLFNRKRTPQSEPIPGAGQTPNSAGGYAWALDDWKRLDRFLVLGTEGGTYYIAERPLTRENAQAKPPALLETCPAPGMGSDWGVRLRLNRL